MLRRLDLSHIVAGQGQLLGNSQSSAVRANGIDHIACFVSDLKDCALQQCLGWQAVGGIIVGRLFHDLDLACDGRVLPCDRRSAAVFHIEGFDCGIQRITVRRLDFPHQVLSVRQRLVDIDIAVLVGCVLADGIALTVRNEEGHAVNALAGHAVDLVDEHGAGLRVLDGQRGRLTSFHLKIVGRAVQQIPLCGFDLGGGVPAVRKLRERDNAVAVGGVGADALAVHLSNLKLHTLDALTAVRVHLDDLPAADGRVGKGQRLRVVAVDLNGLRGAVQHIAVRRFDLRYHISIRFEVHQLDLAVAVRGVNAIRSDRAAVVSDKRTI